MQTRVRQHTTSRSVQSRPHGHLLEHLVRARGVRPVGDSSPRGVRDRQVPTRELLHHRQLLQSAERTPQGS